MFRFSLWTISILFSFLYACGNSKKNSSEEALIGMLVLNSLGASCVTETLYVGGPSCQTCIDASLPTWIKDNFHCVTVTKSGSNYVFTTKNLPPYKSYYYGSTSPYFEVMGGGNTGNPNLIQSQNYTLTIPVNPVFDATPDASSLGAVGISTYGVVLFNNEAAPGDDLTAEYSSFDQSEGHPTASGEYHHHTEPPKLTNNGSELIGVILDGYPIYGKKTETGSYPSLDADTGTRSCTNAYFPSGTYCYHVRNGSGVNGYLVSKYRGVKGTASGK
ncbi:YHYH protein [Leptospira sp. 96542]|nr:YHYH protein [Leptospira sp. 96542]